MCQKPVIQIVAPSAILSQKASNPQNILHIRVAISQKNVLFRPKNFFSRHLEAMTDVHCHQGNRY